VPRPWRQRPDQANSTGRGQDRRGGTRQQHGTGNPGSNELRHRWSLTAVSGPVGGSPMLSSTPSQPAKRISAAATSRTAVAGSALSAARPAIGDRIEAAHVPMMSSP
jgi:hypothetical protein